MFILIKMEDEIFKESTYPVLEKSRYLISNYGNIFDLKLNRMIKPYRESSGYVRNTLYTNSGNRQKISIHRLVAWEFVPGYDESSGKVVVNHKNSNRGENYYENLEWVTPSENISHGFKHGNINSTPPRFQGESHPRSKIDEETVRKICELLDGGMCNKEILKELGHSDIKSNKSLYKCIKKIKAGDTWTHISSQYNFIKRRRRFNDYPKVIST